MIRTRRLTRALVSGLLWSHLHSRSAAEARLEEIDAECERLEAEREALHTKIRQHRQAGARLRDVKERAA